MRLTLLLPLATAFALLAACGDGQDAKPTPGFRPTAAATSPAGTTTTGSAFGPAPKLEKAIVATFPEHGSAATRAALAAVNPLGTQGVCFSASFTGLPEQARSFRMTIDGQEATLKFGWTIPAADNPRPPRACYGESSSLAAGRHSVVVAVRATGTPSDPVIQQVTWEFDVK